MPSIPQSLLWISLVVLWLFVLVPMLTNRRDAVRRTSDVALATRVLTSGASARLLKRSGPAAGHRSDPHWRPEDGEDEEVEDVGAGDQATGSMVTVAAGGERVEPDYLDVDVVEEDSGALPQGADESPRHVEAGDPVDDVDQGRDEGVDEEFDRAEAETPGAAATDPGEYEYVQDTSGLEAEEEPTAVSSPTGSGAPTAVPRRRRYDPTTAAAVSARKYTFRKRVLTTMALILVVTAALAFTVTSTAWWFCGITTGATVLYLAYLRRQTRIEQQVRNRRMQRMAQSRRGAGTVREHEFDVVPSRLRRPGAAVLEIDDEDPAFEHLDYTPFARGYDWRGDLPRAAGQ